MGDTFIWIDEETPVGEVDYGSKTALPLVGIENLRAVKAAFRSAGLTDSQIEDYFWNNAADLRESATSDAAWEFNVATDLEDSVGVSDLPCSGLSQAMQTSLVDRGAFGPADHVVRAVGSWGSRWHGDSCGGATAGISESS